jgi:hypothetical protein
MLDNLVEYYRKSNGTTKKKFSGCNSSKKLNFFKKKVAILVFTLLMRLILRISEGLGSSRKVGV